MQTPTGWLCPRCDVIVAPFIFSCPTCPGMSVRANITIVPGPIQITPTSPGTAGAPPIQTQPSWTNQPPAAPAPATPPREVPSGLPGWATADDPGAEVQRSTGRDYLS